MPIFESFNNRAFSHRQYANFRLHHVGQHLPILTNRVKFDSGIFLFKTGTRKLRGRKIKVSFSLSMYFDISLALEARWDNRFRE